MNPEKQKTWAALRSALYYTDAVELVDNGHITVVNRTGRPVCFFPQSFVLEVVRDERKRDAERLDVEGLNAALRSVALQRLREGLLNARDQRAANHENKVELRKLAVQMRSYPLTFWNGRYIHTMGASEEDLAQADREFLQLPKLSMEKIDKAVADSRERFESYTPEQRREFGRIAREIIGTDKTNGHRPECVCKSCV